MRYFLTVLTYLTTLIVVAVVAFFVVIFLAGPHAGMLPSILESIVALAGLAAVLVLPVFAAYKVWHRLGKRKLQ